MSWNGWDTHPNGDQLEGQLAADKPTGPVS